MSSAGLVRRLIADRGTALIAAQYRRLGGTLPHVWDRPAMSPVNRSILPIAAVVALSASEVRGVIKATSPLRLFEREATQIVQVRVTTRTARHWRHFHRGS